MQNLGRFYATSYIVNTQLLMTTCPGFVGSPVLTGLITPPGAAAHVLFLENQNGYTAATQITVYQPNGSFVLSTATIMARFPAALSQQYII